MKALPDTLAALMLGALIAPVAAWAVNPELTTTLSNVQIRAIDLTPGDGSAASYHITSESRSYWHRISNWSFEETEDGRALQPGETFGSTLTLHQFTSTFGGNGSVGDVSGTLVWDTSIPHGNVTTLEHSYTFNAQLTLTAGSALVLSGTLLQHYIPAGMSEIDPVESLFTVSLADAAPGSPYQSFYRPDKIHDFDHGYWDGWDTVNDFGVTFTNPGTTDKTVNVRIALYSSLHAEASPLRAGETGGQLLSPVPEPGTYAMLGAGLAVLAAVRRRPRAAT